MKTGIRGSQRIGRALSCLFVIVMLTELPATAQGIFRLFALTDNFADRSDLAFYVLGNNSNIAGDLSNATTEAGEPLIAGVSSGQTVWGTWTAPGNGILTLTPIADSFSPLLTVYTGDTLDSLTLVASNIYLACYDDAPCGCHWRERGQVTLHVAAGVAYQVCVDSAIITDAAWVQTNVTSGSVSYYTWVVEQMTNVPPGNLVRLGLQFTPAPPNDDFVNRYQLSGSRFSTNLSNAGATRELGEPEHLGNPGGSSVWCTWTAPASGRVTLSTNEMAPYAPPSTPGNPIGVVTTTPTYPPTCGNEVDQNPPPEFYPLLAAYTGSAVNVLTPAGVLPLSLDAYPDAVEFDAVKGRTYQLAFDGNLGTTGDITLYLALTTSAANENFQKRIQLHGVITSATSYNAGATHVAGEPILGGSSGKTVWWSWRAPVSGTVSIDLAGSDYAFPVAVFTGPAVNRLQMVAGNSGSLSFNAVLGQTYQIAVSDYNGLTGAIKLKLQGPIVDVQLIQKTVRGNQAGLTYKAATGEVIALSYSTDGENWYITQTKSADRNMVSFQTTPAPAASGPFYRAIVFDRTGYFF